MEGWTELQFDIRATYKGRSDDIQARVTKRCEEIVGGCVSFAERYMY